jgi:hypothetical protein
MISRTAIVGQGEDCLVDIRLILMSRFQTWMSVLEMAAQPQEYATVFSIQQALVDVHSSSHDEVRGRDVADKC